MTLSYVSNVRYEHNINFFFFLYRKKRFNSRTPNSSVSSWVNSFIFKEINDRIAYYNFINKKKRCRAVFTFEKKIIKEKIKNYRYTSNTTEKFLKNILFFKFTFFIVNMIAEFYHCAYNR
jgi:hypothetical protein